MDNIKETILEVILSILPITIVITILQFTLIWLPMEMFLQFLIGVLLVGAGLILFLLGVNIGLLPVGEMIGSALSKTKRVWLIVFFGFLLGLVVPIAERPSSFLTSGSSFRWSNSDGNPYFSCRHWCGHLRCDCHDQDYFQHQYCLSSWRGICSRFSLGSFYTICICSDFL